MLRIRINISDLVFYSVSEPLEMEFFLDNPGFEMDVSDQVDIHQADVPGHLDLHHRGSLLAVPVLDVMAG